MGKKVEKAFKSVANSLIGVKLAKSLIGDKDDGSKRLAQQQAEQARLAREAQKDLSNAEELTVIEGAAARDAEDDARNRKPKQGLSGALGLGGL